jgi:predicted O-linked N-acetylglucosamine transferase (SPINDLY family)
MYGLPENATVLCAFASSYKILPDVFDIWMRLLARHAQAVLWLRDFGEETNSRLKSEMSLRGVAPERAIFTPAEPLKRYLARFALADIYLDTAPFGAHTTVNDALFAGLPVLTQNGASFAGRASASQVIAAGLPELVASNAVQYHSIADGLLSDRATLDNLTKRLQTNRDTTPLFDMKRYTREFERAILEAVKGH